MRTPLNTIHLCIDELQKTSSKRELLRDMHAASEVVVDTLNDLISQEGFDETILALDFVEDSASHFIDQLMKHMQRHVHFMLFYSCLLVIRRHKIVSNWN